MKALFKMAPGPEGLAICEVKDPVAGKGELKVKIHVAGICGTDIHIMHDEYYSNYPVILGHEYSGVVEEVGEGVEGFVLGDQVISLTAAVTCGTCCYCRQGLLMLCEKRLSIGSGVNGAMAQYMLIPASLAFRIPEEISMDEAALSEPLASVVRAVTETAVVRAGDFVLVSGPGTIGLLTLQVAATSGAKVAVVGTGADRERLALAMKLGAAAVMTAEEDDPCSFMEQFTYGCGFDVAFECAGVSFSANTCIRLLKKTGHYAQVGLYGKKVDIDLDLLLKKEITVSTSFASERTSWERALRLLESRKVDVSPLISARLPLDQWKQGFAMFEKKEGYKVLLMPNL